MRTIDLISLEHWDYFLEKCHCTLPESLCSEKRTHEVENGRLLLGGKLEKTTNLEANKEVDKRTDFSADVSASLLAMMLAYSSSPVTIQES